MFGYPRTARDIPTSYIELFGNGTKPSEWNGEVPAVEELILQLKDQLTRVKQISDEHLNDTMKKPFMGLETYGELAGLALMHEANHLGQIQAMKRVIEVSNVKN